MNAAVPAMIKKEFAQIRRDKRMLPIIFVAPVLQLLVLGYAANFDVKDLRVALLDRDRSAESRALAGSFVASGYFKLVKSLFAESEIEDMLVSGAADLVLVVPEDFSEKLARGEQAAVQLIADGSDSNASSLGLSYAGQAAARFSARPDSVKPALQPLALEPRVFFNPELKSRNFFVSGILGLLLMIMTTLLTSLAMVREKENGTLEQLIVTPIRPLELMLGKLVPFVIIGFIDVCLITGAAVLLFGLVPKGSLVLLLALSAVFLLNTLGLGLLVSTITASQQQAMMAAIFVVIMPMIILAGFVFPIDSMPALIQPLTLLLPLRYYLIIVRGIFLKGSGPAELWDEAAVLLAMGLALVALSAARFRKRL